MSSLTCSPASDAAGALQQALGRGSGTPAGARPAPPGRAPSGSRACWRLLLALALAGVVGCTEPGEPASRGVEALAAAAAPTPLPTPTPRLPSYELLARAAAQRYLELDALRDRQAPERAAAEARALAAALRASAEGDPRANWAAAADLARALELLAESLVRPAEEARLLAMARTHYAAFLGQPLRQTPLAIPTVVPSYRVHDERATSHDGRPAREVRIEVDPWLTAGDILAVLVAVVRGVRQRSGVDAVVIYAYWSGDDTSGPFTAGRAAYACGGKRAWLGYPPDCATIYIDVAPDRTTPLVRLHRAVPYTAP
jgi:hypothetical protein